MPKKKPELAKVAFKQIATATRGEEVELYGLTDAGIVFVFHKKRRYWVPLVMETPIP